MTTRDTSGNPTLQDLATAIQRGQADAEPNPMTTPDTPDTAALCQQIEDLLDEFSGVTETRIVAGEIVARLLWRKLAEIDRLRAEVNDLTDAAVRSGERLMDAQEQRRALWEVAKGLARHLRSAKTALDDDSLLRMAEQTAERLRVDNTGLRFRAELAEGERDKANRQLESLARRLHLRFQNEQRLESALARLSSGDTPTPTDVIEQAMRLLTEHQRFDIASCRCGWGRQPRHLGKRHSRHVADVLAAAGLLRPGDTPQSRGEGESSSHGEDDSAVASGEDASENGRDGGLPGSAVPKPICGPTTPAKPLPPTKTDVIGETHRVILSNFRHHSGCGEEEVAAAYAVEDLLRSGLLRAPAPQPEGCECFQCVSPTLGPLDSRMVLCPDCGNKRCPHATWHGNACTGSNEPGQPGSRYAPLPSEESR